METCILFAIITVFLVYIIQKVWLSRAPALAGKSLKRIGSCIGFHHVARSCDLIPIDDLNGKNETGYTKNETELRCQLASLYRVMDRFGWTDLIYNHITVRVDGDSEHFLLNPYGLLYDEITASSLVKVDLEGNIVGQGSMGLGINVSGFVLHSAIHGARHDIKWIIHHHHPAVVAVSSLKCGLLNVSQDAAVLGEVGYHDYKGILFDQAEKASIVQTLGPTGMNLFLRNHGIVCCGKTAEEAFMNTYSAVQACVAQMKMMSAGIENIIIMSEEARRGAFETKQVKAGVNSNQYEKLVDEKPTKTWGYGEQEFEALMRQLDNEGYQTGHNYKQPLEKSSPFKKLNNSLYSTYLI